MCYVKSDGPAMAHRSVPAPVLAIVLAAAALSTTGCGHGVGAAKGASAPRATAGVCEHVGMDVLRFGESIEDAGAATKGRLTSYAGLLELLLSFERASTDLESELGAVRADDADLRAAIEQAAASLGRAREFARTEREAVERHAREVAPLARETQEAWVALRAACGGKKSPADCVAVRDLVARYDAAETSAEHVKVIDALAAVRASPAIARTRDRAVSASRTVHGAIAARTQAAQSMPKKWAAVQKDVTAAMDRLADRCRGTSVDISSRFVAESRPDPRRLTVLVKVRPPAKVEQTFAELASAADDDGERAFYEARAKGAFGSGFLVVRPAASGDREVLVITNRHVVDLGERAALELADGSSLGSAEIVYTDPTHDVAILRPSGKLAIERGFAFSTAPAKDQQVVIATGFPGMVGRPSYQTTRGYVSNESFRLEEAATRPLTYVQHTAPIDPGSSGGPLTDERGHVLGVNTMKVTNREAVGLAVPSSAILETIRRADGLDAHRSSAAHRREAARLACLSFIAELATHEPRMAVLEPMIANTLVGTDGLDAASVLEGDPTFEGLWQADTVRAMRIAALVRIRAAILSGGGASVLETCNDANAEDLASILTTSHVRFRVRLANFETRDMTVEWEQGHWKVSAFDTRPRREAKPKDASKPAPAKDRPSPKKPAPAPARRSRK